MCKDIIRSAEEKRQNISNSSYTIYDPITPKDCKLWLSDNELEYLLRKELKGKSYKGLPNRTRSKVINQDICKALGYPVPKSFKRVHPRFLCQNFDKYAQQSTNLQIWNEEISPTRRYCLIILDNDKIVINVVVMSGCTLQKFDTTGKLTTKYQANLINNNLSSTLLSRDDTKDLKSHFGNYNNHHSTDPGDFPKVNEVMGIEEVYDRLSSLLGTSYKVTGNERKDGNLLQSLVYKKLNYSKYNENGQLPDLMNQLIEVKRQTSPTIDLGLFKPNDSDILNIPAINGYSPKVKDIRYAIFYCDVDDENKRMTINKLLVVTGTDFFCHFHLFDGNKQNKKIQMHLNKDLWIKS